MIELVHKNGKIQPWIFMVLVVLPIIMAVICLGLGRFPLTVGEVVYALTAPVSGAELDPTTYSVVFNLRLPRTILAIVLGAGLACAGAAFQALFANPLATPDTLGVTAGASVGAVIALMLEWSMFGVQATALVFGLASVLLTITVARIRGKTSIVMLVLAGVIISALFSAVISILKYTADPFDKLPAITYWLMGSLSGTTYYTLAFGIPFILIGLSVIFMLRWRLNILTLSEDEARAAGINVQKTRMAVIVASTMVTASCVSMCGQVGWVGLLIPHCARMICGSNNRFVIPFSISFGAVFMVLIDTMARTIIASEIPISVLTALIGAPFFISLLRKTGGNWE